MATKTKNCKMLRYYVISDGILVNSNYYFHRYVVPNGTDNRKM